ncbi:DEAD/DEAH box helicase [Acholeplasma vituli]|uniref:DEAD/DEAH box helicase n=1 Tax=Paracholeplasma vituli TaxID=69473 RepID=A0ABT2PW89_9MOLU|nr:DEAD/DEAH box helicase [Paracholeplasma vituli]
MNQKSHYNLKEVRDALIEKMDASSDLTESKIQYADQLYSLGLTVYSQHYTIESSIYNSFTLSKINTDISLHPEQTKILKMIDEYDSLIVSAPTSFGKTYCIFEYIARKQPHTVVLIVPTLALTDEYMKKFLKNYKKSFLEYKVYTNIEKEMVIDSSHKTLFILTHDKVVAENDYKIFDNIDFLVIDEVYKLKIDESDDRVLILNLAYYHLSKISKKYVLLAPFISNILNLNLLEKKPKFLKSNYSPVVNKIEKIIVSREKDRHTACDDLLETKIPVDEKTLVYFPTPASIKKYITKIVSTKSKVDNIPKEMYEFIDWAKDEIHEDWYIIKAIERGYLVHNGQLPLGIRMIQLDYYEDEESDLNKLLCTSTLLEGVNTSAKNIIITRPSRLSDKRKDFFTAFDFYNLVGRTGRLNKHLIGIAYYIKSKDDPEYLQEDSNVSILFEITENTKDVSIQIGDVSNDEDINEFFGKLRTNHEEYKERVGSRVRFETCKKMLEWFDVAKMNIKINIKKLMNDDYSGYSGLLLETYRISETQISYDDKLRTNLISNIIDPRRFTIKQIVERVKPYFPYVELNDLIGIIIKLKSGQIEHQFYNHAQIIKFFMEKSNFSEVEIECYEKQLIHKIENIFFVNSIQKKMMQNIGIYERDIDHIVRYIGSTFNDVKELRELLNIYKNKYFSGISFLSRYVINNLTKA